MSHHVNDILSRTEIENLMAKKKALTKKLGREPVAASLSYSLDRG